MDVLIVFTKYLLLNRIFANPIAYASLAMSKYWTFTNFALNSAEVFRNHSGTIRYLAYGEETCPSTGKPHHQGIIIFHNERNSKKQIGKLFLTETNSAPQHVEIMRASFETNKRYCSKEGQYHEFGDKPQQGMRSDLIMLRDRIMNGANLDDIAIEQPHYFHQYQRTLERLRTIYLRRFSRQWQTEGLWLWGPTGSGKSHQAFQHYRYDRYYSKCVQDEWWDGYDGQEVVIINEFRGQIPFSELLDLLDKYPKTVRQRHREPVPFLAKKIIITSHKHPKEVYLNMGEDIQQLYRRCEIKKVEKNHEVV